MKQKVIFWFLAFITLLTLLTLTSWSRPLHGLPAPRFWTAGPP